MPSRCHSRINARSNSANAAITDSNSFAIAVFSPVKVRFSVTNWTRTPARQRPHQPPKIVEIACQPVHRVHDDGVAVPDKREQRLQLRPRRPCLTTCFVNSSMQLDIIELAIGALIQGRCHVNRNM
jgi:hypothetical protein